MRFVGLLLSCIHLHITFDGYPIFAFDAPDGICCLLPAACCLLPAASLVADGVTVWGIPLEMSSRQRYILRYICFMKQ